MEPTFSIVIPAFNQAEWLERALFSVARQAFPPHEVIVINDGSTDRTRELLDGWGRTLRVIHQENQGLSASRNRGAAEATGDYVVYLDSDDILLPWAVEVLRREAGEAGSPSLILSLAYPFRDDGELRDLCFEAINSERWPDYLASSLARYRITVAGAIRRDVLLESGGFLNAADGAEDHDFWLRTGTSPGFVYIRAPAIYGYRQHGTSVTHRTDRVFNGISYIIEGEKLGRYPGGAKRAAERRALIGNLAGWGIQRCHETGGRREAVRLYLQSTLLLLRLGMHRKLIKLLILLLGRPRSRASSRPSGARRNDVSRAPIPSLSKRP